jgi:hypothetical protein
MLHSVAPRDAARLQVTGYACRGDADTRMRGHKPFESKSCRKAILPKPKALAIAQTFELQRFTSKRLFTVA